MRRREVGTLALCALLALAACQSAPPAPGSSVQVSAEDRQAIQGVLDTWLAAWNRHDMKAWAQLFTADADFVPVNGQHLMGREAIFAYHQDLHQTAFRNRQQSATWKDLRFIRSDIALGHIDFRAWTPGDDTSIVTALATVALEKQDGRWLIYALQNIRLTGEPAPRAP